MNKNFDSAETSSVCLLILSPREEKEKSRAGAQQQWQTGQSFMHIHSTMSVSVYGYHYSVGLIRFSAIQAAQWGSHLHFLIQTQLAFPSLCAPIS